MSTHTVHELRRLRFVLPAACVALVAACGSGDGARTAQADTLPPSAQPVLISKASTAFTVAQFGLTQPRVPVVLSVADTIRLDYQFTLVRDVAVGAAE